MNFFFNKKTYFLCFVILSATLLHNKNKVQHSLKKQNFIEYSGIAMTIPYSVKVVAKKTKQNKLIIKKIINSNFEKINKTFNNWNPYSEISIINQAPSNIEIKLTKELFDILLEVNRIVSITNGLYDPTIGSINYMCLKNFHQNKPPLSDITKYQLESIGWHNISLINQSIIKLNDNTKIDLCGISKGLAVDMIADDLVASGLTNCFVNWGGEIKAFGRPSNSRQWSVYIDFCDKTTSLTNEALATSGDYHQRFLIKDKIYTHIINPITHTPLESHNIKIKGISVITKSCAECDAIATALMLFNSNKEIECWASKHKIKIITD